MHIYYFHLTSEISDFYQPSRLRKLGLVKIRCIDLLDFFISFLQNCLPLSSAPKFFFFLLSCLYIYPFTIVTDFNSSLMLEMLYKLFSSFNTESVILLGAYLVRSKNNCKYTSFVSWSL